jgi:hypothetical protein
MAFNETTTIAAATTTTKIIVTRFDRRSNINNITDLDFTKKNFTLSRIFEKRAFYR